MGYPNVRVNTAELSPTQASVGGFEVMLKADRFKLMSAAAIDGYLADKADKGKPVQVVKGLNRYFVVDGHHTLSAILSSRNPRELTLALREDFSKIGDEDEFWEEMADAGLLYDRCLGMQISALDFPVALGELIDDPFRSIAWIIRKMDAYDDLKLPYQEFRIADFLREYMAFSPVDYHEYETACIRAYELMRSKTAHEWAEAHELPGLKGPDKKPPDLLERYYDVIMSARRPRYYQA